MYNYSFHLLAAIGLQPILTSRPYFINQGLDDNVSPRANIEKAEKSKRLSPAKVDTLKRLLGAERNCFDGLPYITGAIVRHLSLGRPTSSLPRYSNARLGADCFDRSRVT